MHSPRFLFVCLLSSFATLWGTPSHAQINPDQTLGAESSIVTSDIEMRGELADVIEGGTTRGSNLFHSFSDFSVLDTKQVYFANPDGIELILSRVTGDAPTNILGTLGVNGTADLFFINPNGLFFGQDASLDIDGSFVGTTANSLQFEDFGFFSTTSPGAPSELLTVNPSALLFNISMTAPSGIRVEGDGSGTRVTTDIIDTQTGLRVPTEQTLALIGGDLDFVGGTLKAAGGQIELGSVESDSSIQVIPNNFGWTFDYSNIQDFKDVRLVQQSTIDASGLGGGNIHIQGQQVLLFNGSTIEASTIGEQSGGRIRIVASDAINIFSAPTSNSFTGIYALVYRGASGAGGDIIISTDLLNIFGSPTNISTSTSGSGQGGDLTIDTRQLNSFQGQISASTFSSGNAGNLTVRATESLVLAGENSTARNGAGSPGGLFTQAEVGSTGNGGNLIVESERVSISDGSKIQAISFGRSDGITGNVEITADDIKIFETAFPNRYTTGIFVGTGSDPTNTGLPEGNGGSLTIRANDVSVRGGEISADTSGQGNAGSLLIEARDSVEVINTSSVTGSNSSITANVNRNATGRGGDLTIETSVLTVTGSQISASTSGVGRAGNLSINADVIELSGEIPGNENGAPGGLFAIVDTGASGQGGNLNITTERLSISEGSKAQAISLGNGDAGNVVVNADEVNVFETADFNYYTTGIFAGTGIGAGSTELPVGNGGSLTIRANDVSVRGGEISADTVGKGNAGNLLIEARDSVEVIDTSSVTGSNSSITANVNRNATGRGGDLTIETSVLTVTGSQISASTLGTGKAGNLTIRADSVELSGENPNDRNGVGSPGGLFAQVDTTGTGDGGSLFIADRSKISAYKFPSGINLSKAATEQRLSASIQGRP